jgi:hypothetical protein
MKTGFGSSIFGPSSARASSFFAYAAASAAQSIEGWDFEEEQSLD